MNQTQIMLQHEGDAWFTRNRDKLGQRDPVTPMIQHVFDKGRAPRSVLEIGCANGWRLTKLQDLYRCRVHGLEPSIMAIADSKMPEIMRGTAEMLPFADGDFDLVIYGFCLYLTEPRDWFQIVAEGDRVLRDGGTLIIHDFKHRGPAFARKYAHREQLLAYHVDFAQFWLAHPRYTLWNVDADGDEIVIVLHKNRPMMVEE